MPENPTRFEPRAHASWLWGGFLFSNLLGFGSVGLLFFVGSRVDWGKLGDFGSWTSGILGVSHFFLIPFGMGFSAAFFWRAFPQSKMAVFVGANFLLTLVGAFCVLREGVICLIMASPLLFFFQVLGANFGYSFWQKTKWLGVTFAPLFVAVLVFNGSHATQHSGTVTTSYTVKASPAQVWRYVAGFPKIDEKPDWWMWKLGLPVPTIGWATDCWHVARMSV